MKHDGWKYDIEPQTDPTKCVRNARGIRCYLVELKASPQFMSPHFFYVSLDPYVRCWSICYRYQDVLWSGFVLSQQGCLWLVNQTDFLFGSGKLSIKQQDFLSTFPPVWSESFLSPQRGCLPDNQHCCRFLGFQQLPGGFLGSPRCNLWKFVRPRPTTNLIFLYFCMIGFRLGTRMFQGGDDVTISLVSLSFPPSL